MAYLENAKRRALEVIAKEPAVGDGLLVRQDASPQVWLGIGYALGKGWATYRGSRRFSITDMGRKQLDMLRDSAPSPAKFYR